MRRLLVGVVTGDKASKTRRVEIERIVRHKKYSKIIRRKTVCHAHDEDNVSAIGDKVEIEESRPLSKLKRWTLVRIVEKSKEVDVAALRAARKESGDVVATMTSLAGSAVLSGSQGEAN
jgi:small subunit ribosomal protein S17